MVQSIIHSLQSTTVGQGLTDRLHLKALNLYTSKVGKVFCSMTQQQPEKGGDRTINLQVSALVPPQIWLE